MTLERYGLGRNKGKVDDPVEAFAPKSKTKVEEPIEITSEKIQSKTQEKTKFPWLKVMPRLLAYAAFFVGLGAGARIIHDSNVKYKTTMAENIPEYVLQRKGFEEAEDFHETFELENGNKIRYANGGGVLHTTIIYEKDNRELRLEDYNYDGIIDSMTSVETEHWQKLFHVYFNKNYGSFKNISLQESLDLRNQMQEELYFFEHENNLLERVQEYNSLDNYSID